MLTKRQINLQWVEQVIEAPELIQPDPIDPALEHRLARVPQFGSRVLRVILNTQHHPPLVVTVFFDRRKNIL